MHTHAELFSASQPVLPRAPPVLPETFPGQCLTSRYDLEGNFEVVSSLKSDPEEFLSSGTHRLLRPRSMIRHPQECAGKKAPVQLSSAWKGLSLRAGSSMRASTWKTLAYPRSFQLPEGKSPRLCPVESKRQTDSETVGGHWPLRRWCGGGSGTNQGDSIHLESS